MLIECINNNNHRKVYFADMQHWEYLGNPYCSLLPHNYGLRINDNDYVYILNNHSGFTDNNGITNFFKNGIAENGEVFKTNNFGNKLLNINYIPSFEKTENKKVSPQNYINSVLQNKNEALTLNVYTNQGEYTMEVVCTEETSTESGAVQWKSANDGDGIYWRNKTPRTHTITGSSYDDINDYLPNDDNDNKLHGYITKQLTYIPLTGGAKNTGIPTSIIEVFNDTTIIKIKVGSTQKWTTCKITNKLTGEVMTLENKHNDDYLIISPNEQTITNVNGDNRIDCKTSDDWLKLDNGINEIEWELKNGTELVRGNDSLLSISYYDLYTSVF